MVGLQLKRVHNVIIRNLKLSFSRDDLIQIYDSHNIWVDHDELWNDRDHHKDYYDGLVDITVAASTEVPPGLRAR